jgi:hypothetical protein
LFPKSIAQIVAKFDIEELHLTFTQGRWNYNQWGMFVIALRLCFFAKTNWRFD